MQKLPNKMKVIQVVQVELADFQAMKIQIQK